MSNTITERTIMTGLELGIIKLIKNPQFETGTVCQIGEHWFYFGGETADEYEPDEFWSVTSPNDIIREITESINNLPDKTEYSYYKAFLSEQISKRNIRKLAYELYKIEWLAAISTEQKKNAVRDYYEYLTPETEYIPFKCYLEEFGYDGDFYATFDEFIENEYQNKEYMKNLLSDKEYQLYLIDITEQNKEE